jgi:hypothetical protein
MRSKTALMWVMAILTVVAFPLVVLAQAVSNAVTVIEVPQMVTDVANVAANTWITKTFSVGAYVLLASQIIKKALAMFGANIGGAKAKWLVAVITFLSGSIDVVSDGKITPSDWVTVLCSLAAGVGMYFGYKLLFKQPVPTPPPPAE